ncbi:DUF975 family protein [Domibacillus sp. DTU_2020_1001157_1_SI_ALB_TIR_016]|uniref:DUF975 family protein n=1 Tax=Domibacillus sp. DTU_2020_1001157_1_SI_ALB_TIR_016 TaxID=3077789 RepID=UPI0028E5BB6A|nr:DUF975 family protein [Domibacillus sp. DTU_2020_1001157_1_SI_ALB_TIR_016]WNS81231.1 DUF975 family protein [Domibacillus sp. DTU_2020_1001157_1_SI_ALB_TIR_016]
MYYSKLRAKARDSLRGNWLIAIGLFVVATLLFSAPDLVLNPDEYEFTWKDPLILLLSVLLLPVSIGLVWAWVDVSRGKKIGFGHLIEPYKTMFGKSILVAILQGLFLFLWTLLFIVPGIIKSFSYLLTYYILRDEPGLSPLQAITKSRRMMDGHKAEALVLGLSFIGWILLGVVTLFIGFLWIAPYMSVTYAHFYNTLRAEYEEKSSF